MGLLRQIFHYATLGVIESNEQREKRLEWERVEAKRKATHFDFLDKQQEEDYKNIINKVASKFKRIEIIEIYYQFVTCRVSSVSGATRWDFQIDFNDFGKLTGKYWWGYYQNSDAIIGETFAETLSEEIIKIL